MDSESAFLKERCIVCHVPWSGVTQHRGDCPKLCHSGVLIPHCGMTYQQADRMDAQEGP